MTVVRNPKKNEKDAVAFIEGAPDAKVSTEKTEKVKGLKVGNKQQISLTMSPDLLLKVDRAAKKTGQSRASFISMAVYRFIGDFND